MDKVWRQVQKFAVFVAPSHIPSWKTYHRGLTTLATSKGGAIVSGARIPGLADCEIHIKTWTEKDKQQ